MATVAHLPMWSALGFELVVVEADPLRATIRASGALDLSARDSIVEVLARQRDSGRVLVRLELTEVTFMDCACLRVLVDEHRRFLAARGQLVLTGIGPRISRLLELTGLDRVLLTVAAGSSESDDVEVREPFTQDPPAMWHEQSATSFDVLMAIASAQGNDEAREPGRGRRVRRPAPPD